MLDFDIKIDGHLELFLKDLREETKELKYLDSKKAEVLIESAYSESNNKEIILQQFNNDILKKYNVTKETYDLSLKYYMNNPKEMDKLINSLKHKNKNSNVN
jgi:hypothetical protein